MLQVWLLGQFDLKLDGRRIVLSARAAQSLLAYLILSAGSPHRREKLAGLFWSDLPEESARRNLRHELWRIRKTLVTPSAANDEYLLVDDLTLTFNPNAPFWLDAAQLQRVDPDLDSLSSTLSLYRGELLPGMYDDWVSLEREHLQSVYERKMQLLLEKLIAAERWNNVVEWSERWLAHGQSPEPAYRALMVAHGAQGNLSQVALDYERCVQALRDDIGIEPSANTRALFETLTRGVAGEPRIAAPLPTIFVQPSGTITFLFTDIEGSTKLLEKLGSTQYADLLADQRDILRATAEKYNGHEVDTQGDAFFFAFFRAADAINFAADAQRALDSHTWTSDVKLRVRMGLHTGEPMLARTGYVGMDVHRAARIGAAGHGGQVLLSQSTGTLVENQLPEGASLKDLGEHKLKDLRYPIHIIQLTVEGLPSDFPPLKASASGTEPPAPGDPPFKGLEFFDESDAALFFGREELTSKLIRALNSTAPLGSAPSQLSPSPGILSLDFRTGAARRGDAPFLAVIVGASGSGKSSLVRAGIVPALKQGTPLRDGTLPPPHSDSWTTYILTPTAHPLEALATALTRDTESVTATAILVDDLKQDPRALHLFLRKQSSFRESPIAATLSSRVSDSPSALRHSLIVVDQFEELFTLCRDEFEREAFIDNLLTALSYGDDALLTLILTLRADFYAHLAKYPELRDAVAKHQEFIGPMTSDELRRAIQEPAQQGGWEFEPGLVDLILRDVGDEPGALPLLSHALLETWHRRSGHTLTLKGYHDAGGVRGAIAQTAETTYQQLTPAQQTIARNIFLRLTELGEGTEDTRRRASFDELIPHDDTAAAVYAVLRQLADARLITLNADSAEVAHEALIREWSQLREWLNQDRDGLRLHRQITEAAQEWELLERDPGALYRGARLIQARDYAEKNPSALNAHERTFVQTSEENEIQELRAKEEQQKRELFAAQKLAETESRRAAEQQRGARRLRWFAAGLALLLLAALAAAYLAFNQSAAATNNFVTAERIRLASQAQIALDNGEGGDLPALLSLQSLKHGYSTNGDTSLVSALRRGFTRQIFIGHTDLLWSVDFSPDGKKMVTTSNDGTARVWDVASGKELARFVPSVRILTTAAFLPDGRHIVVGGPGDALRLWDTETNQEVRQYKGLVGGSWGLDVSADGKYVVSGDDKGAKLFDLESGELIRDFNQSVVASPAMFSPDGKMIATANGDKTARIWDVASGKELLRLDAGLPWVVFSPDGKSLFSGAGNVAQLWDVRTGEVKQRFLGHTGEIIVGAFSPDGKYLATGGADKTARLWDVATGQQVKAFIGHTATIFDLKISPDGLYLLTVSADRTARLWEIQARTEPQRVRTFGSGNELDSGGSANAISLSPDSQFMVAYSDAGGENRGKELSIRSTQNGDERRLLVEISVCTCTISDFAFSPDNRLLVGSGDDGVLWLWDAQSGKLISQLKGHSTAARAVIFSSDGRAILSAGDDKTARLWDPRTGQELQKFSGHTEPVWAVAFSQDGKLVLTGSDDKTAHLWDAQTGLELKQLVGHTGPVRAVAFSPDGKFIVTGGDDQIARVWDSQTGKELRQLIGHTGQVSQVVLSPDGQFILTGSVDQTARLWNSQSGQVVREFVGHTSPVFYIGFADNGRTIITGDSQNAYRWRASLDDVIAFTCSQLTRDLTADERALYRITDPASTCPKFAVPTKIP